MSDPNNRNDDHGQNRAKDSNTPSFLSPVGESSTNYLVALDEDEVMDLSPITPAMSFHPPLNNDTRDRSRNSPSHWNGHARRYEASYGVDDDRYVYNLPNGDDDNDLPTPLLGYDYQHEDNGDDRYHHNNNHTYHHEEYQHRQNSRPKLNGLNYLNVITYGLNVFTSYFIGVRGLFGVLPTRSEIFLKYQTLVTPANYAYWLWVPILVFEFFFATAQLLPIYRARPIIQQGTGLYFFWACIIQTVWTVFFAMRWFISSFVAVVLALFCLIFLLASQHYNALCAPTTRGRGGWRIAAFLSMATAPPRQRRKSKLEYWFFRFPFYLHCGWLLVCMVVQFSMAFRFRFTDSTGAQLAADIIALGVMLPAATFFLTGQSSGPDFVIPAVIIWSYVSIGVELRRPSDTLVELYGHPAILAVQIASYVFTGIVGCMLVPRVVVWIAQEFCTIDVVELDDHEDSISTTINEVRFGVSSNNDGLLQRSSPRSSVVNDESVAIDPTLDGGTVGDNEENLASIRRRIDNMESVPEEGNDEDEDQYEDCRETENVNHS